MTAPPDRRPLPGRATPEGTARFRQPFVRSTPGVAAALVGMKTGSHVRDNLALSTHPQMQADRVDAYFR